jgi:cell division protein FtsW
MPSPINTLSQKPMAKSKEVKQPHALFLQVDVTLLLILITLLVIGLVMIYSASWNYSTKVSTSYVVFRQARWILLGGVLAIILSRTDYHRLQRFLIPMMLGTLVLLVIVLVSGESRFGATRAALPGGSVQPSELAKLATIIYLAFWLHSKREHLNEFFRGLLPMGAILGIICGLIILQPDLSATLSIIFLGAILFFVAGGELRQIVLVGIVVGGIAALLIAVSNTGQIRLADYLAGLQDPKMASYHVQRSIEAIVRGKLFGVGLGNSSTKFTGLPVPWTDSIFAVLTEETGLIGAAFVLLLYMMLLWRGLKVAQNAPDLLGKLLASGVSIWITMEALINMGVLVNILPFAGNALPLMSAGGSSMVTVLMGVGILMSVAYYSIKEPINSEERRGPGAIVDLRWRDRRRRVSRTSRAERPE